LNARISLSTLCIKSINDSLNRALNSVKRAIYSIKRAVYSTALVLERSAVHQVDKRLDEKEYSFSGRVIRICTVIVFGAKPL